MNTPTEYSLEQFSCLAIKPLDDATCVVTLSLNKSPAREFRVKVSNGRIRGFNFPVELRPFLTNNPQATQILVGLLGAAMDGRQVSLPRALLNANETLNIAA